MAFHSYNSNTADGKDLEKFQKAIDDLFFYANRVNNRLDSLSDEQIAQRYQFRTLAAAEAPSTQESQDGKGELEALLDRLLTVPGTNNTPTDLLNYLRDFNGKIGPA